MTVEMIELGPKDKDWLIDVICQARSTDIRRLYLSERTKVSKLRSYMHPLLRIMSVVKGKYSYRICRDNIVQPVILSPGNLLFCSRYALTVPPEPDKMEAGTMLTLIFFPQHIRFLISVTTACENKKCSKHYWYHTGAAMPRPGWDILQALNQLAHDDANFNLSRQLLIFMYDYCLARLRDDQAAPGSKSMLTYHRIKACMVENMHLAINRKKIAQKLELNPSHISKLFKRYDEHNFNASLKLMRMELAMELVRENHFSIDEISEQCGFVNTGYFIKSFREFYGKTPGAFRIAR